MILARKRSQNEPNTNPIQVRTKPIRLGQRLFRVDEFAAEGLRDRLMGDFPCRDIEACTQVLVTVQRPAPPVFRQRQDEG